MTTAVTGGSGFIGSHLANALLARGADVLVLDKVKPNFHTKFVQCDLSKDFKIDEAPETLFHFAASPDVKKSMEDPRHSLHNNVVATHNILEFCRRADVKKIVFASTSAVYGNAEIMPTPETAELKPISIYGATKVACEAFIRSYHETYGMDAIILRYANIYGPGSDHGVMHDFVNKLQKNNRQLEILGNGMQSKSYLYIDDAIEATILAAERKDWSIFNIGSETQTTVKEIAAMVINSLELENVHLKFTGDEAGWPGDVPKFLLDIKKIKSLGWAEKTDIKTGIDRHVEWLVGKYE